jgi:hypothetical protein
VNAGNSQDLEWANYRLQYGRLAPYRGLPHLQTVEG